MNDAAMRSFYVIAGLGCSLLAVAILALINPPRFTGVDDLFWLWWLLVAAGLGALGVAALRLAVAGRGVRRWTSAFVGGCALLMAVVTAVGTLAIAYYFYYPRDRREMTLSADGRFAVVVYNSPSLLDPVDSVYVETTEGWFSKRDRLGNLNGDDGDNLLASARFAAGNRIVLQKKSGEQMILRFDPVNVRAIDRIRV